MSIEHDFQVEMVQDRLNKLGIFVPTEQQSALDTIINALAYGCCLKAPRTFNGIQRYRSSFMNFSEQMTVEDVCYLLNAWNNKRFIPNNPYWFVLGIISNLIYNKTKGLSL